MHVGARHSIMNVDGVGGSVSGRGEMDMIAPLLELGAIADSSAARDLPMFIGAARVSLEADADRLGLGVLWMTSSPIWRPHPDCL